MSKYIRILLVLVLVMRVPGGFLATAHAEDQDDPPLIILLDDCINPKYNMCVIALNAASELLDNAYNAALVAEMQRHVAAMFELTDEAAKEAERLNHTQILLNLVQDRITQSDLLMMAFYLCVAAAIAYCWGFLDPYLPVP